MRRTLQHFGGNNVTRTNHLVSTVGFALICGASGPSVVTAMLGCRVPDLDMKFGIPHRTYTHWAPLYGLAVFLVYMYMPSFTLPLLWLPVGLHLKNMVLWFFYGALFHILEDLPTTMGVPFLLPRDEGWGRTGVGFFKSIKTGQRWTLGLTKTGGFVEYVLVAGVVLTAVYVFFTRIQSGHYSPV